MFWEKHNPLILSALVVTLMGLSSILEFVCFGFPMEPRFLLSAAVTLGSIFTAFMATSLSILVGADTPIVRRIWESDYNALLLSYYKQTIFGSLWFCLVSVGGFFDTLGKQPYYFFVWVLAGVFALLCFIRTARIVFKIIETQPKKW